MNRFRCFMVIVFLGSHVGISGCGDSQNLKGSISYDYAKELEKYLNDNCNSSMLIDKMVILLPLRSCNTCVDESLRFLEMLHTKNSLPIGLIVVFVGQPDSVQSTIINSLKLNKESTFCEDFSAEAYKYQLNMGKPMFIFKSKADEYSYLEISKDNFSSIEKLFTN